MDKDFFVQELEAHSGMLYRVAYTLLHDDDACRDALQDAALKAWEKRQSLRETRFFRTWITRITINTWNVICQGQIYPILKFLSHNTHIFIKIAKETVVCCLFCRIGYEQRKARNATGKSASLRVNFLSFGCIFMMLRDRMCFLFSALE